MKKILPVILICCLFLAFSKKDENKPSPGSAAYSLPGLWMGTYNVDQVPDQGALPYTMIFKPDGTLLAEGKGGDGGTYYTAGNWVIVGDSVKSTFTSINYPADYQVTQLSSLYFNNATGELTGSWKDGDHGSNYSGKYQNLTKVN
ncbi:MAG: hypothetical protein ABI480_11615 [Chitinophagaceae bacterium]